jgi:hypothetical protein
MELLIPLLLVVLQDKVSVKESLESKINVELEELLMQEWVACHLRCQMTLILSCVKIKASLY